MRAILWPWWWIAGATEAVVNWLGPADRPEPASHYLSGPAIYGLVGLSFVLYWLAVTAAILILRAFWLRVRRPAVPKHSAADAAKATRQTRSPRT